MNKNIILSIFLIIVLLCIPAMIMGNDPITLDDMKIQYTHFHSYSYGDVEFGEIKNGQELAIIMLYRDRFLVRIWNFTDEDLYLDPVQPFNIIEGQDLIHIEADPDPWILKNTCFSFCLFTDVFYSERRRMVIEIRSESTGDENFVFGLWAELHC